MKSRLIQLGLAIAAVFAAPIAASAADLGPAPSYKAPAYVAPSYATWSGFYVGVNAGYGFGKADAAAGGNADPKGFLAGGTIGYNLQTGVWVWGIEGDIDYSAMKDDSGGADVKVPWFATARGRIGYAGWGNLMPYITGGAAFANLKVDAAGVSDNATRVGWTAGAGLEYAMWSNWSVKVEYLYADLGTYSLTGGDVDFTTNIVRAGLNYRF
jgi:outer membrane immunogenic protein